MTPSLHYNQIIRLRHLKKRAEHRMLYGNLIPPLLREEQRKIEYLNTEILNLNTKL